MDENKQRNDFTGTVQDKPSGDILNPMTGQYRKADGDSVIVAKSDRTLWPSISSQVDSSNEFQKHIPIFVKKSDKQIVCGIVYEPDTKDAQGDQASADEIRKAAYDFMENAKAFKVMHKGKLANVEILESFIAPQDLIIGERKVKKGSWVITTKINDSKIWQAIKDGELTGFSMSGYARVD